MYELHKKNKDIFVPAILPVETTYVLYNILTNERVQIQCDFEKLENLVAKIIHAKYTTKLRIDDEEFMQKTKQTRAKYFFV